MIKNLQIIILLSLVIHIINAKSPNKILGGFKIKSSFTRNSFAILEFRNHRYCGGNIISNKHILTTASCVLLETQNSHVIPGNLKVRIGANNLFSNNGDGELYDVKYVIYHENYMPQDFWKNDIAILSLEKSIIFMHKCEKIDLTNKFQMHFKAAMVVTGVEENIQQTNDNRIVFRRVTAKPIPPAHCDEHFSMYVVHHGTQSCLTTETEIEKFTMGDAGSGVIWQGKIVGITSVILPNKPRTAMFTKVYSYQGFIKLFITNY